tara:strand:+ start:102 stop:380 length:279 start_codon:yes stop_codon:yes gene_type:complete
MNMTHYKEEFANYVLPLLKDNPRKWQTMKALSFGGNSEVTDKQALSEAAYILKVSSESKENAFDVAYLPDKIIYCVEDEWVQNHWNIWQKEE